MCYVNHKVELHLKRRFRFNLSGVYPFTFKNRRPPSYTDSTLFWIDLTKSWEMLGQLSFSNECHILKISKFSYFLMILCYVFSNTKFITNLQFIFKLLGNKPKQVISPLWIKEVLLVDQQVYRYFFLNLITCMIIKTILLQ